MIRTLDGTGVMLGLDENCFHFTAYDGHESGTIPKAKAQNEWKRGTIR